MKKMKTKHDNRSATVFVVIKIAVININVYFGNQKFPLMTKSQDLVAKKPEKNLTWRVQTKTIFLPID